MRQMLSQNETGYFTAHLWNQTSQQICLQQTSINSSSGIVRPSDQSERDPTHDYDQIENSADLIICSECEDHPMDLPHTDAITLTLRTVAQAMDIHFDMDPAGDIFIDILSLQDILPQDLYFFTDIMAPFACPHPIHVGCYFRHIFSQLSLDTTLRIPWSELRCPLCRAALRENILTRFFYRDRIELSRFSSYFFPTRLSTGTLQPPSSTIILDFGPYNTPPRMMGRSAPYQPLSQKNSNRNPTSPLCYLY